jgi:hypothetical protein
MKKVPSYFYNSQEVVTEEFLIDLWTKIALHMSEVNSPWRNNFSCSLTDMMEIIMALRDLGYLEMGERRSHRETTNYHTKCDAND